MSLVALFSLAGSLFAAELKTVPSFENCSLYWTGQNLSTNHAVQVKEVGASSWQDALPLSITPDNPEWRGSLFGLSEDTEYDVRIMDGGSLVASCSFKTWTSVLPVAKEYTLKELSPSGRAFVFNESGTETGWIRIKGAPEHYVVDGGESAEEVVLFTNASYVIFEDITVLGGARHGITIGGCENIRVRNCNISGFGRVGEPALCNHGDGKYFKDGELVNHDAGVNLDDSENVVVERCFIHSPRGAASPWRFSHPAGSNAVYVKSRGGTVLRYNDFIGCDVRRWNDAVEGWYNKEGGFLRDSDIYGNMFAFANDDGIELDGLQMNIRAYRNRFEASFCGISTAPCMAGPSYIFQNLISELGDEDGFSGYSIKNNYSQFGYGRIFLFNNTVVAKYNLAAPFGSIKPDGRKRMLDLPGYAKVRTRNNIFVSQQLPVATSWPVTYTSDLDYDLLYSMNESDLASVRNAYGAAKQCANAIWSEPSFQDADGADYSLTSDSAGKNASTAIPGIVAAGSDLGAVNGSDLFDQLPFRPLVLALDKGRVTLDASMADSSVTVCAVVAPTAAERSFTICKPDGCDWFSVEPAAGVVRAGESFEFTVRLNADKLPARRRPGGAFLVRFADGLSRPVLVYAGNAPADKAVWMPKNGWRSLLEAESFVSAETVRSGDEVAVGASGQKYITTSTAPFTFSFDVPEDGEYQVCLRVRAMEAPGFSSLPATLTHDGKSTGILLRADEHWRWCGLAFGGKRPPNRGGNRHYAMLKLAKGLHTYSIAPAEDVAIDAVLIMESREPAEYEHE